MVIVTANTNHKIIPQTFKNESALLKFLYGTPNYYQNDYPKCKRPTIYPRVNMQSYVERSNFKLHFFKNLNIL